MSRGIDVYSVVIYLFMFESSILFMSVADHYLFSKNGRPKTGSSKIVGMFFLSIGTLIPCVFAALRSLNVGIDVNTYITSNFKYGLNNSLSISEYINGMPRKLEILFATLLYFFSQIGSIRLLFFVIQLLIMVPIAIALIKIVGKGALTFGFTLYYFLFYNFSLSGMRQSIAMSFLLLILIYLFNKRYKKAILFLIIGQLFHSSLILIILLIGICILIYRSKYKKAWICFLIIGLLTVLFGFSFFSNHIIRLVGTANIKYAYYITRYLHSGYNVADLYAADLLCKTLIAVIPLFMTPYVGERTYVDTMIITFVLLGRYFVVFNGVFYEAMRIAFYFDLFLIVYIPLSQKKVVNQSNKSMLGIAYISLAVAYWLYFIMYIGGYGTKVITFNV